MMKAIPIIDSVEQVRSVTVTIAICCWVGAVITWIVRSSVFNV